MARIMDLLADDQNVITYRPALRELTGCATGIILLQQILHRAKNNKWKPFYKFTKPCEHEDYREGDSWLEELGFTESEFSTARDYIAVKITTGANRKELDGTALVWYWTDATRKTWYEVDQSLTEQMLQALYDIKEGDENAKPLLANYIVKRDERLTKKGRKRGLHIITETSENTENSENQKTIFAPPHGILKEAQSSVNLDKGDYGTQSYVESCSQSKDSLSLQEPDINKDKDDIACSYCGERIQWGDVTHKCRGMDTDEEETPSRAKIYEPRTELALCLQSNTSWPGFRRRKDRIEWEAKEHENRDQLKQATDWALKKENMPERDIDRKILAAYPKFNKLKMTGTVPKGTYDPDGTPRVRSWGTNLGE